MNCQDETEQRERLLKTVVAVAIAKSVSPEELLQRVRARLPDFNVSEAEINMVLQRLAKAKAEIAEMEALDQEIEEYCRCMLLLGRAGGSA
jgi:DNA-binding NarL/FixJ family response regulator